MCLRADVPVIVCCAHSSATSWVGACIYNLKFRTRWIAFETNAADAHPRRIMGNQNIRHAPVPCYTLMQPSTDYSYTYVASPRLTGQGSQSHVSSHVLCLLSLLGLDDKHGVARDSQGLPCVARPTLASFTKPEDNASYNALFCYATPQGVMSSNAGARAAHRQLFQFGCSTPTRRMGRIHILLPGPRNPQQHQSQRPHAQSQPRCETHPKRDNRDTVSDREPVLPR